MKWIGQHIYDQISRFRNSVYLEDISTGTIASGGNLGLDSNNKIVKANEATGDITGVALTAGTGVDLTSVSGATGGAYAATIGVDVSDFMTNGGNDGEIVTSTGTDAMTANTYLTFVNTDDISSLSLLSNQDTGDKFRIDTTTHGATTITTIDDDYAAASLTFNVDGNVYHKSAAGFYEWYKSGNDDDRFRMSVGTHGDTALITMDAAAAAAHMTLYPDGDLKLTPKSGTTYFYDSDNTSDYLKLDIDSNGGAAFTTVDAAAANAGFTINADGVIEFNAVRSMDLTDNTYDAQIGSGGMAIASSAASGAQLYLQNTADDATGGRVAFVSRREDGGTLQAGEDSDIIGTVKWSGYNDNGGGGGPDHKDYASIIGSIADATTGQEAGNLKLFVASYDGATTAGLQLLGDTNADGEVDVTIANGAASTTTISGTLTMGSTAAMTNAGLLSVANQTGITGVGTISSGTWQGTAINQTYLVGQSGTNTGDETLASINALDITEVGTIDSGVWQGTAIASAYLDADTAHYSATRQVTHHMITDDIDSDVIYISLLDSDSETSTATNKQLPFIAPTAGKLLKIFLRTSVDYSSETFTWKLYTRNVSSGTGGAPSEIGAQSGAGPTNKTMVTYDFTSSLDSGTNAIAAGDKVQISIEAGDGATANGNYFITCLWEWDLS